MSSNFSRMDGSLGFSETGSYDRQFDWRPRTYIFGTFAFQPERQRLKKGDRRIQVGSRALEILAVLVERPGELVLKRELIERVWPDTIVEESNLKTNMSCLRRALDERHSEPEIIATVVGRGYRFVAPLTFTD